MKAPLIFVTPSTQQQGIEFADVSVSLSNKYSLAVRKAGGLPMIASCLPDKSFVAESVARCDGVLLTGGDDIQPELYDPQVKPELRETVKETEPERDLFELMVIEETFRQQKPMFCICRGHQLVNVAFGGTLFVDIPTQIPDAIEHRRMDLKNDLVHDAELTRGSLIWKIARNAKLGVNSSHHQAVDRVAEPFNVTARSADGVVEAMELKPEAARSLPYFLAVQFHPERLFDRYTAHAALFREFVKAAGSNNNV